MIGPAERIVRVFLPFAAGYLLSYLYRTVTTVTGPLVASDLALDAAALGTLAAAYFAAFAAVQIPLGIALDRFGPRRCEALLLGLAAGGSLLFALAEGAGTLTLARAIIGVGVAACLMAAFKANVETWPPARLPLANGVLMAFGGLGAALGTIPAQHLADAAGWRAVFLVLAAATLIVALWQWLTVPDAPRPAARSLAVEAAAVRRIVTSRVFWAVAPVTAATHGAMLAYQSLWAAPWLTDVAGLDRRAMADVLFWMSIAIIPGYGLGGVLADRLLRAGARIEVLFALACAGFIVIEVPLALGVTSAPALLWFVYVLLGVQTILGYPLLTQRFAADTAGRVNTALNMVVFGAGFGVQALVGMGLHHGHAAMLWLQIAVQTAALVLYLVLDRERLR